MIVQAPLPGVVHELKDAPDPVFAAGMVGPGAYLEPEMGRQTAVSPISGKAVRVMPHAFVVLGDGVGVLVHLGVNTVRLKGEGFEVLAKQGDKVEAGTPMVTWDPSTISKDDDMDPAVLIVAMDQPADAVKLGEPGRTVAAGDTLMEVGA